MQKHAYIFIGQSGAGKGTQAALFETRLRAAHPDARVLHLETGNIFRSFIGTDSYTAQHTKTLMNEGKLPPSFIGVHVWSHELIAQYNGQEIVILDGTPRVIDEVPVLLSAARFYGWQLHVVSLEVTDTWADARLLARGRPDDIEAVDRAERIAWFHGNVSPAIALLKEATDVHFVPVGGERTIEEIHEEIWTKINSQIQT